MSDSDKHTSLLNNGINKILCQLKNAFFQLWHLIFSPGGLYYKIFNLQLIVYRNKLEYY